MKLTPEMIEAAADVLRRIKANGLNPASYIAAQSALYAAVAAIDTAGFAIVPREHDTARAERDALREALSIACQRGCDHCADAIRKAREVDNAHRL